jgi:hypothetical protein
MEDIDVLDGYALVVKASVTRVENGVVKGSCRWGNICRTHYTWWLATLPVLTATCLLPAEVNPK